MTVGEWDVCVGADVVGVWWIAAGDDRHRTW